MTAITSETPFIESPKKVFSEKAPYQTNGHSRRGSDGSILSRHGSTTGGGISVVAVMMALLAVLLSGFLHITVYPPPPYTSIPVSDQERSLAPGKFVTLSRGTVHYRVWEPLGNNNNNTTTSSPPILLIHGFSMGQHIWEKTAEYLRDIHGRTVITFDLYGRGFSDAAFPNDMGLFTGQVSELLYVLQSQLGPHTATHQVDVVGISMGGAIATAFAVTYPHHVRKMVLLAPAGLPVNVPLLAKLAAFPLIGDVTMPILGPLSIKSHAIHGYANPDHPDVQASLQRVFAELARQQQRQPGFYPSLLSTIRHYPLGKLEWAYHKLAQQQQPDSILVIWGNKDVVTPFENSGRLMDILGDRASLSVLDDCGHVDMLSFDHKRNEMLPLLANFLKY